MEATRTQNSSRNSIWAIIKFVLNVIVSFILRTMVLRFFGTEFSGLIASFSTIISMLAITELGIGGALVYKLYKPINDGDDEEVRCLLSVYKNIYYVIAGIILAIGMLVMPFLKTLTSGGIDGINIYILFFIFLLNSVITYFVGHRQALIFVSQRNFIESFAFVIATLVIFPLQILFLTKIQNVYYYILCNFVITLLQVIIILIASQKQYNRYKKAPRKAFAKEDKKELIKNTYAIFSHKISTMVFSSADTLIISIFLGLTAVTLYSNYYMIIAYLFSAFAALYNGVKASVGSYITTHTSEESLTLFKKLNLIFFILTCICSACLTGLFQPFIVFWGGLSNANLLLEPIIPFLFMIYFLMESRRGVVHAFKDTSGLFWGDRYLPLISSIINVALSILLLQFIGLKGIIIGTIVSLVPSMIVETKITFNNVFKKSTKKYWVDYLLKDFLCLLICGLVYFICSFINITGILGLFVRLIICVLISTICLIVCFFKTTEFKFIIEKIKK